MLKSRVTNLDNKVTARKWSGSRKFAVSDVTGSVLSWLETDGAVSGVYRYWPFGEALTISGAATALMFCGCYGYYTDRPDSVYVRSRYFSPIVARWLTVDATTVFWRPYCYVQSPGSWIDLDGEAPLNIAREAPLSSRSSPSSRRDGWVGIPTCYCLPKAEVKNILPRGEYYKCLHAACLRHCREREEFLKPILPRCDSKDRCLSENSSLPSCTSTFNSEAWAICGPYYCAPASPETDTGYIGAPANESNWPVRKQQLGVDAEIWDPKGGLAMLGWQLCCVECKMRVCCDGIAKVLKKWQNDKAYCKNRYGIK